MEYHYKMQSENRPKQIMTGPTGTWYHYNIVEKQGTREETGETYTYFEYDGFWFPGAEYEGVKEGRLPTTSRGWDASLWRIFTDHQHSMTDNPYLTATRHIRTGDTTGRWTDYQNALDLWNTAVDNLQVGDTNVPLFPVSPEEK